MATTPKQIELLRRLTEAPASMVSELFFVSQSGSKESLYKVGINKIAAYIGNSSSAIQLSYASATTNVSNGTLSAGALYQITDATQANGGKGSVFLTALNNNTFSNDAIWKIDTDFKGFGWIDLEGSMIPGDTVTSIAVGAVNQLSASVAFVTDYDALAIAIAANINANVSATYTAKAIKNRVILQNKSTGSTVNGDAVTATGTSLVPPPSNIQDVTNGQDDETLMLSVNYNFTENQIYKAYYEKNNITVTTTDRNNGLLGHNPIYYFPFGDKNSAYGSNRDTFENSEFNGQTFKDVYYVTSFFDESVFHTGFDWDVTNGCALRNAAFDKGDYIAGGVTLSGSIHSFFGNDYFNLSRCIFYNDSNYNFTNATLGGQDFAFGRKTGDVIVNFSNSTLNFSQNSKLVIKTNGNFSMTNTTFNGHILVQAEDNIAITADGINSSNGIIVDNYLIENINIDLSSATLTGDFSITSRLNDCVIDLSGSTSGGFSVVDTDMSYFDITLNSDIGAKTITLSNSNLRNYDWTIPVSLVDSIYISKTEWSNDSYSFNIDNNFNGAAGNGQGGGAITVEQTVPDNWFVTESYTEGNLSGTGNVQLGFLGATDVLLPATLATSLNSIINQTVTKTKTTSIRNIEGAVSGSTPANDVSGQLKLWVKGKIGI